MTREVWSGGPGLIVQTTNIKERLRNLSLPIHQFSQFEELRSWSLLYGSGGWVCQFYLLGCRQTCCASMQHLLFLALVKMTGIVFVVLCCGQNSPGLKHSSNQSRIWCQLPDSKRSDNVTISSNYFCDKKILFCRYISVWGQGKVLFKALQVSAKKYQIRFFCALVKFSSLFTIMLQKKQGSFAYFCLPPLREVHISCVQYSLSSA